jgi:hypothetical protein
MPRNGREASEEIQATRYSNSSMYYIHPIVLESFSAGVLKSVAARFPGNGKAHEYERSYSPYWHRQRAGDETKSRLLWNTLSC